MLAFEALHKKGYIYRDLKPENILVAADGCVVPSCLVQLPGPRWTGDLLPHPLSKTAELDIEFFCFVPGNNWKFCKLSFDHIFFQVH